MWNRGEVIRMRYRKSVCDAIVQQTFKERQCLRGKIFCSGRYVWEKSWMASALKQEVITSKLQSKLAAGIEHT